MSPSGKGDSASSSKSNGVPNINDLDLVDKPLQVRKMTNKMGFNSLCVYGIAIICSFCPKEFIETSSPWYILSSIPPLSQVDKWDGCAVKNALDDTVKKIMIDTYGYAESHALMDGRLIICTVACLFALFAMVSLNE